MRILFADKYPEHWLEPLAAAGHEYRREPDLGENDLVSAIGDAEVLVVRSTRVNAEVFSSAGDLKLVIRAGAGTNTIDRDAAREHGIAVCNTPGKNAVAVAELAMGLILCIDRRIPDNVADLRRGAWDKKGYSKANGILGSTLGVLGIGSIGMALMERARVFGMNLLVIAKPGRDVQTEARLDGLGVVRVPDLKTLAARSDWLSVHLPANDDTRGILGAEVFDVMKPGAAIINTSRGEVIDEAALVRAMDARGLKAGLDVYQNEPGAADDRFGSMLASHPNVYGTHHIGASTNQSQDAVAEGVSEVIAAFAAGKILNCVNGMD